MKKAATQKVRGARDDTLIVAIAVWMELNRPYCTTPGEWSTKFFKFDNTGEGLDTLWGMVMSSKNRFKCNKVIVGYESTIPYGESIGHYLAKKPVTVVRLTPCAQRE